MTPFENLERVRELLARKSAGKIPSNGLRRTTRLSPRSADKAKREKRHKETFAEQAAMCRLSVCCTPSCRVMPPFVVPHHIESRNGGSGLDRHTVPLCRTRPEKGREGHHEELHRIGQRSFQARHQIDLELVAIRYSEAVASHECWDWAVQSKKTGAVSCGVCGKPCDAPVGP